jgi:hypothetical protein
MVDSTINRLFVGECFSGFCIIPETPGDPRAFAGSDLWLVNSCAFPGPKERGDLGRPIVVSSLP